MGFGARASLALIAAIVCWNSNAGCTLAAPTVRQILPRGLQAGAVTTVVVEGAGFGAELRLLGAGLPIVKQTVKPGASPMRAEIEVTLDPAAVAGIYLMRLATNDGVSNAEPIAVSSIPEMPFAPRADTLPIALSGVLSGSAVMNTSFTGRAGQKIVVDVMARRFGAAIDPVVRVTDSHGRQIGWSPGMRAIGGDARTSCVLPADGEYHVELHDSLYRAAEPGQFRLCIGELSYADFVYPLAVERGHNAELSFLSASLAPQQSHATFVANALAGPQPASWPAGVAALSGARPAILVSDFAAVTETTAADGVCELPAAPVVVSARLAKAKATGVFRLPVNVGQKLRVEVMAERLGLPVDGVLSVEKDPGGQLASNDDRPNTKDPGVDVTVPADAQRLLVKVHDLYGAGGDDHLYQLIITPLDRPDFALSLPQDTLHASPGAATLLHVTTQRSGGYNGPIKLVAAGLPAGWTLSPSEIPAGVDQSLLSIVAAADAPVGPAAASLVSIHGESVGVDPPIARPALAPDRPAYRLQPWLRGQLAAAPAPAGSLELAWAPWSADTSLVVGAKIPVEIQIKRAAGAMGVVRLTLSTSQIVPKKTVKVNNADKSVDAVERALRLATPIEIAADQTSARGELIVPGDLPPLSYDLVLVAELLSADAKTVLATAAAPTRRLASSAPMKIELTGPAEAEGRAGLGDAGRLSGKVIRSAGFASPVKIQLAGLPKDAVSPSVTVPGDASEFALPLTFRFGMTAGALPDVKLVAVSSPDAQNPLVEARSNEIPVKVTIVAGEKPPTNPPLTIFEDQPEFIAALSDGAGKAALETEQKFSGAASCKVTPDQRFNPNLPGLGVKIRESPGPGEYRFLQFAWLKKEGAAVCLQLNHDGTWGPQAGSPAKFRYHAGGGPECYGGSLLVSDKLPTGFTLVTRDLFADFGPFTLNGIALSPVDGEFALFDHIYLGQTRDDFEQVKP